MLLEQLFASEAWSFFVCYTTVLLAAEMVFCLPVLPRRRHALARACVAVPLYVLCFNSHIIVVPVSGTMLVAPVAALIFLASTLMLWAIFDVEWAYAVFFVAAAQSVEGILFLVRHTDAYFPGLPALPLVPATFLKALNCALVLFLVWLIFVRRYRGGRPPAMDSKPMLAFVCATLLVANLLSTWVRAVDAQTAPYAVCSCLCYLLLLIIQFDLFRTSSLESERDLMRRLFRLRERQQKENQESMEVVNVKFHDLKHQIAALRQMEGGPARERALAELEHSICAYDASVKTGNVAVYAILTEKSMQCWAREIDFSCVADGACLSGLPVTDLYTLLGNVLDNAIEAAQQVPTHMARVVQVKVWRQGEFACLSVENSCVGKVELKDGLPLTSKADPEYHGFGLRSIRSIAEAHHGTMALESEEGRFSLTVLLPAPVLEAVAESAER